MPWALRRRLRGTTPIMRAGWVAGFVIGQLALFALAPVPHAALPKYNPGAEPTSLAGQLLIASPRMPDPRFQRTVILMVRHGEDGALGITINRPVQELPLATLLEKLGETDAGVKGSVQVFAGGPVQPQVGSVLHSGDYRRRETVVIDGRFAMTQSPEVLRDIAAKRGPHKALVAFGYAGWAPGQLEAELGAEAWLVAPADPQLVFDEPRDKVWEQGMAVKGR
jgi:putative transcriptional regulator